MMVTSGIHLIRGHLHFIHVSGYCLQYLIMILSTSMSDVEVQV
jgi:hypothetical protein